MAIDQNSIPSDLRPLNLGRTMAEEPRVMATTVVTGRNIEGLVPNSVNLVGRGDVGSPRMRPMFYPVTMLDSGGNPTIAWYPYQQNPVTSGGNSEIPNFVNQIGGNADQGIGEGGDVKKVKLLCSFGGKILPRPNDGLLRYVGGQTRIISVRRDISFQELQHKMIDTYGQPVVIKYQLPNEDLDALVSVSCQEDLDNMMEEYGKLLEDGSRKLRVFLFSASELDQSARMQFSDVLDSGRKYIDAINGILEGIGGGITRKESIASGTSTQSDGQMSWGEALESSFPSQGDGGGIPSPCMSSPKVAITASHDTPTSMGYVTPNPVMYAEPPTLPMGHPIVPTGAPQNFSSLRPELRLERPMPTIVQQQQPLGYNLQQPSGMDFRPPVGYMHAYVDPRQQISPQIGYPNPQLVEIAGSGFRHADPQQQLQEGAVGIPPQQFIPAVNMTMAPSALHTGLDVNGLQQFMQPPQTTYPGEHTFGARVSQFPVEQSYSSYQPQVTIPLHTGGFPLQTGGYGWNEVPPAQSVVVSDGWVHQPGVLSEKLPKLEDCNMCQKALPHVHSDILPQDQRDSIRSSVSDSKPVFHSYPIEGNLGTQPPNRGVVSGGSGERMAERQEAGTRPIASGNIDHDFAGTQFRVIGAPQDPELLCSKERISQKPDSPDHSGMLFSQGVMGKPADAKSPYGAFSGNIPQSSQEEAIRQPSIPLPHQVKQEALVNQPVGTSITPVSVVPLPTSESMVHGSSTEFVVMNPGLVLNDGISDSSGLYNHLRPTEGSEGRKEVHVSPSEISGDNEQHKSSVNNLKKEDIPVSQQQIIGQGIFPPNDFMRSGVASDGNHIKLVEMPLPSSSETAYIQNFQPVLESNQVTKADMLGISAPYPHLNMGVHHMASDQIWQDVPRFSDAESNHSAGVWKDEASRFQPRMSPKDAAAVTSCSISLSPSDGMVQNNWSAASSNSLFSNQDPWTLRHDARVPFPKTSKVPSNEGSYNMREKGVLQKPEEYLNEDSKSEHVRSDKEEHIKQELKAVAEGVADLVLQSPTPVDFSTNDMNAPPSEVSQGKSRDNGTEGKTTAKVEEVKTKLSDKANPWLPISEGLGRLQIIKNSDLEELQELGSGTFGTVYHGKWRGSDVAIKRINDRCFAGKPSEQERMRDDFWNEAIKLADLHHPNVVAFYGVVLDGPGGSVATVTEFMVNGSLRQALQKNDRTLDKRKRLLIAMDVAFGMEYLHGKNIVHFDLKSDNLLVNLRDPHRPICKVGDLGLSKVKCQTLISGGVRGTLPWMAPELLNGSSSMVSEKVDVFSFGIVMWELLTGEEPYADLHYGAIIGGIVSNTLRPSVPESCDSEWRSLMESCWSAEPSERPSFTEIASQLRLVSASLSSRQAQQQPQAQKMISGKN